MTAKPKTRERILQASLELFNSQGERSVTTNHIAAHLGISPGNLYYHFRNKQMIIAELFATYEAQVDDFLRLPPARPLTVEDKALYLEALLAAMWQYRFLHRDLEHLLAADAQLAERYGQFARRSLDSAQAIYRGFVEAGVLTMNPAQIEALSINAWIILTSWCSFSAPWAALPRHRSARICCGAASSRCWRWSRVSSPLPLSRKYSACSSGCTCRWRWGSFVSCPAPATAVYAAPGSSAGGSDCLR